MVSIDGFDDFAETLRDFADKLRDVADVFSDDADDELEEIAEDVARDAQRRVPVDTGRLSESIGADKITDNRYEIGTNVDYAQYVEFGTRPHKITPKDDTDGPLVFKVDDEWVATYEVDHPGAEEQPFLGPALRDARADLDDRLRNKIRGTFRDNI